MSRPKFTAYVKNAETLKAVREYIAAKGYPDSAVVEGTIQTAQEKLGSGSRTPEYLLVELAGKTAKAAFADLDKLANVCEPDTKVIISGDIDELSFYKELIGMGVNEYLLNPVKAQQIDRATTPKVVEKKDDSKPTRNKSECKIIAVIGARGGVGASTIAINMAKIFSNRHLPTAILDFDPQYGTVPLLFDVEPNRGLVDALEKPERIDALFLERVMTKISENLYVIGAEKNLNDGEHFSDKAAQVLIDQLCAKVAYIIVDIPRVEFYHHHILKNAENIIVTELSLPGLRDTLRIYDLINEGYHNKKIRVVANKVGVNKKYETSVKDFESGFGKKFEALIPFEPEIYGFNSSGSTLADSMKDSRLAKAINNLATKFLPTGQPAEQKAESGKKANIFNKIMTKK